MLRMSTFISKHIVYTFTLLILPSLIIVSWLNVFAGNANYSPGNYFLTFVLPAAVFAYLISLLAAESLHEGYSFNSTRVLFTFVALFNSLLIYSFVSTYLGVDSFFVTAHISGNNIQETASKFYCLQLTLTMMLIVIFYSLAAHLFKENKRKIAMRRRRSSHF